MVCRKQPVKVFQFRPNEKALYIFLIALAIFIFGIQVGIKHGRELQKEDIQIENGYFFAN